MALGGMSRAASLWGVSRLASEKFLLNAMLQGRSFPCRLSVFITGLKLDPDVVRLAIVQCFFSYKYKYSYSKIQKDTYLFVLSDFSLEMPFRLRILYQKSLTWDWENK
jgi:hypothetical protein